MPTSDDFELVAARLRDISAVLEEFAYPLENRMGPDVLEGGELTDSVYEAIKGTRVTALSLSATVEEYAAEATRRMEEAIAAAKALKEYRKDLEEYNDKKALWDNREDIDLPKFAKGIVPDEEPTKPTPPPDPPAYIDL
ncbi:MAG: hypothetical protein AAF962_17030 [Actinomycetota bacterium]